MDMPSINSRVLQLIDYYTDRNVKKFAHSIDISQQTLNRLFNIDTRTQKYPTATTDVLIAIAKTYVDVDAEWLLTGRGEMFKIYPEGSPQKDQRKPGGNSYKALCLLCNEKDVRIKEKDSQLKEKDSQINKILDLLTRSNNL